MLLRASPCSQGPRGYAEYTWAKTGPHIDDFGKECGSAATRKIAQGRV